MDKKISEEFTKLNDRLKEFGHLKKDWDGYDSEIISPECISRTKELLGFLLSTKKLFPNFVAPYMCPVPTGNVQIEWEIRNVCLEIEIFPDHYEALVGSSPDYDQEEFTSIEGLLCFVKGFFHQISSKSKLLTHYLGTLIEKELCAINDATKEIRLYMQWLDYFDGLNKANQADIISEMHSRLVTIPLYKHLTEEKLIKDLTK